MSSYLPDTTGVVLVDHGSRFEAANVMMHDMARLFAEVTGVAIVEPAHMEIAEPTIAQACARCIERGARRIVVQPYFLSPGRHSTRDIPAQVTNVARQYEGVEFVVTEPMGLDPRICGVLMTRVQEGLTGGVHDGGCGGRGSDSGVD